MAYNYVIPSYVKDVLYIKKIERLIGRKLDVLELEAIYHEEPIYFEAPNGRILSFVVPIYRLPSGLMNKELELAVLKLKTEPSTFYETVYQFIEVKPRGEDE